MTKLSQIKDGQVFKLRGYVIKAHSDMRKDEHGRVWGKAHRVPNQVGGNRWADICDTDCEVELVA